VRNGLGDREASVRKAAAAMLGGWVDHAEGELVAVCAIGFVCHEADLPELLVPVATRRAVQPGGGRSSGLCLCHSSGSA